MSRISQFIKVLLFTFLAAMALEMTAEVAEARAGGRRSMGRSSKPAQSQQYRQTPPNNQMPAAAPPQRGGFGRALAGGIAGGFLGSMLFSSLGNAAPGVGGAGGAGGIGLIEIILLGGLAFLAFRWWKSRQQQKLAAQGAFVGGQNSNAYAAPNAFGNPGTQYAPQNQAMDALNTGGIDSEEATDIFFKVQGAFTRRDLTPVADRLNSDMYRELGFDLENLKAQKKINRLENISVRSVEVLSRWNEAGTEYASVRFTASLLDYTVDETTGQVIEGSEHEPVKFNEDWTFARTTGYAPWQLAGIAQV